MIMDEEICSVMCQGVVEVCFCAICGILIDCLLACVRAHGKELWDWAMGNGNGAEVACDGWRIRVISSSFIFFSTSLSFTDNHYYIYH